MFLQSMVFCFYMRGSREGTGGLDPPAAEKSQKLGVLSNNGPDPLQNPQSYQGSIQCWAIIGPFHQCQHRLLR